MRGGKTVVAAAEFARRIYGDLASGKGRAVTGTGRTRRPRLHYWVVAPDVSLLKEPMRCLNDMLPAQLIEHRFLDDSTWWLRPDILIEFKSADNPLKLVAAGVDGLWIDEVARVKADAWRGQLRQRLSDRQGWGLFSTTPLGRNWFYDDIVKPGTKSDADYDVIQWTTADNLYIPREEIEAARRDMPERYFKREYEASFDAFSGTVFDEFGAAHCITEAAFRKAHRLEVGPLRPLFRRVLAGIDWGWNAAGAVVVVGELAPGDLMVLDESYATNRIVFDARLSSGTWVAEAQRLRQAWGISQFFADPSRPDAIYDFVRAGLPCVGADNEILFGVRKMAEAMHPRKMGDTVRPCFRVLEDRCPNLVRELRDYVWAQTKDKSGFVDMPADGQSDHAIDPCRYSVVELLRHEMPETKGSIFHAPPRRTGVF